MSNFITLPSGGPLTSGQVAGQHMNIKRINWEKLDNSHVENTVWEQVSSWLASGKSLVGVHPLPVR